MWQNGTRKYWGWNMRSQRCDSFHIKGYWSLLRDGCKSECGPSSLCAVSPPQSCGLRESRGKIMEEVGKVRAWGCCSSGRDLGWARLNCGNVGYAPWHLCVDYSSVREQVRPWLDWSVWAFLSTGAGRGGAVISKKETSGKTEFGHTYICKFSRKMRW